MADLPTPVNLGKGDSGSSMTAVPVELKRPSQNQAQEETIHINAFKPPTVEEIWDVDQRDSLTSLNGRFEERDPPETPLQSDSDPASPSAVSSESKSHEKSKRVSSTRKRRTLLLVIQYHFLPVFVTSFLTTVYARKWTWQGHGPSPDMISALQFLAKIHEGLILLSVSNIIFHRLRYLLLSPDGIPLGLLSSPYHLSSPLHLISNEFLGAATDMFADPSAFFTTLLIILAFTIVATTGPLSATLMIPRQGLWQASFTDSQIQNILRSQNSSNTEYRSGRLKIHIPPAELYPTSIGPDLGITWACKDLNEGEPCLSIFQATFRQILIGSMSMDHVKTLANTKALGTRELDFIVLVDYIHSQSMQFVSWFNDGRQNIFSIATCPLVTNTNTLISLAMAMEELGRGNTTTEISWADDEGPLPTKQPLVMMQLCDARTTAPDITKDELMALDLSECFDSGIYPAFNFTIDQHIVSGLMDLDWTRPFLRFVDIQGGIPYPVSAAAIFHSTYQPAQNSTRDPRNSHDISIAIFVAKWVETENQFINSVTNGETDSQRLTRSGSLKDDPLSYFSSPLALAGEVVRFDTAWVNSLDLSPYDLSSRRPSPDTTRETFFGFFLGCAGCTIMGLPSILAAIMSTSQCSFGVCGLEKWNYKCDYILPGCAYEMAGDKKVTHNVTRKMHDDEKDLRGKFVYQMPKFSYWAYGYAFRGAPIIAGFVVLYVHVLFVVLHIAVIVFGGFWTSNAWSNPGDLIILGICSTQSAFLRNAGVGANSWKTWRLNTTARLSECGDQIKLIVSEARSRRKRDSEFSTKGQKYGITLPQPDRNYG